MNAPAFSAFAAAALNYVWDTRAPAGTVAKNAYTDFAKMIVVHSESQSVGAWVSEERDVYDDYPYGDIAFERRSSR